MYQMNEKLLKLWSHDREAYKHKNNLSNDIAVTVISNTQAVKKVTAKI